MYGDTTVIRGLARRLRDQGADIRAEADSLVAQAEAVRWSGLAADAMRSLARAHAGDLRQCAVRHDDAADGREAGNHASVEEPPRGLPVEEQDRVARTLYGVVHPQAVLLDVARLVGPAGKVVEALVRRAVRTHAATLRYDR